MRQTTFRRWSSFLFQCPPRGVSASSWRHWATSDTGILPPSSSCCIYTPLAMCQVSRHLQFKSSFRSASFCCSRLVAWRRMFTKYHLSAWCLPKVGGKWCRCPSKCQTSPALCSPETWKRSLCSRTAWACPARGWRTCGLRSSKSWRGCLLTGLCYWLDALSRPSCNWPGPDYWLHPFGTGNQSVCHRSRRQKTAAPPLSAWVFSIDHLTWCFQSCSSRLVEKTCLAWSSYSWRGDCCWLTTGLCWFVSIPFSPFGGTLRTECSVWKSTDPVLVASCRYPARRVYGCPHTTCWNNYPLIILNVI